MEEIKKTDLRDGDRFECKIRGSKCKGVVTAEGGNTYLCQDVYDGSSCRDKKGYRYSYYYDSRVTDFRLINDTADISCWRVGDIITDGHSYRRILFINDYLVIPSYRAIELCEVDKQSSDTTYSINEFKEELGTYKLYVPDHEPTEDEQEKALEVLTRAGRIKDGKVVE